MDCPAASFSGQKSTELTACFTLPLTTSKSALTVRDGFKAPSESRLTMPTSALSARDGPEEPTARRTFKAASLEDEWRVGPFA